MNTPHWKTGGTCTTLPAWRADLLFHPEAGAGRSAAVAIARTICADCPVAARCLAEALAADERHGIWGGHTEAERERLRDLIAA